jgi:hypothetical protein
MLRILFRGHRFDRNTEKFERAIFNKPSTSAGILKESSVESFISEDKKTQV